MEKIKIKWDIDINQDIDAATNPKSPFYDKKLSTEIVEKYGSIDKFKEICNKVK